MADFLNISKAASYVTATWLVMSDRLMHSLNYTNSGETIMDLTDSKAEQEDKLSDFPNFVRADLYNDEETNKRLCYQDSLMNQMYQYIRAYDDPIRIIDTDNIFLGSAVNATNKSILETLDIKMIINCAAEISNHFDKEIEYKKCSLYDNNTNSIATFLDNAYLSIIDFQERKQGNILVHCMVGCSRSVAVVTYYIMRNLKHVDGRRYTFDEAFGIIKAKKTWVNPTFRLAKDVIKAIMMLIERDNAKENDAAYIDDFAIEISASIYNTDINKSIIDNVIGNYLDSENSTSTEPNKLMNSGNINEILIDS